MERSAVLTQAARSLGLIVRYHGWVPVGFPLKFPVALFLLLASLPAAAQSTKPTFGAVAPIFSQHCVQCHRQGGIAAMAPFTSYESTLPWAQAIKAAVVSRQMPPWSADPEHSLKFRNDPRLREADIGAIRAWVDAGTPPGQAGTEAQALDTNEWHGPGGRKPDLVISMNKDVAVPATGDLPYVRFLVPLPLAEDRWVAASQARPGNASVVHHMAVTEVSLPDGLPSADIPGLESFYGKLGLSLPVVPVVGPHGTDGVDMLSIYTPGAALEEYPDDSGKLLKGGKNRYIDFNIHYAGHGMVATDRSEVAFWFRDTPPRHQIYRLSMSASTILANGTELLTSPGGEIAEGTRVTIPPIPPRSNSFELIAITPFPQPVTFFQFHPHAHLRAHDFRYTVVYPDGREETVLSVPKYDFHWQMAYELATPLKVPAGSKLVVTAHYDNSAGNPANPAPDQTVLFRAQNRSTDEMFSPFAQYSVDTENPAGNADTLEKNPGSPLVQSTGCLSTTAAAHGWLLDHATKHLLLRDDGANAEAISEAAKTRLGAAQLSLVGLGPFQPEAHRGAKVIVQGLETHGKINVTSLLQVSRNCP